METQQSTQLTSQEERLVHAMQLLGDKTRFKLFKLLMNSQQMCVSELASELHVSPSAVSQHFRSLELVGLVDKERDGQKICYLLTDDGLVDRLKAIINSK